MADNAATMQQAKETLDCAPAPARREFSCTRECSQPALTSLAPSPSLSVVAFEISRLLDTGLDRETLSILVALTESGVSPEALANVVKELRREAAELRAAQQAAGEVPPPLAAQASEGEPSQSVV